MNEPIDVTPASFVIEYTKVGLDVCSFLLVCYTLENLHFFKKIFSFIEKLSKVVSYYQSAQLNLEGCFTVSNTEMGLSLKRHIVHKILRGCAR